MQTNIPPPILQQTFGQEANDILRSCVHCGFCNATCPTYQLLGDELDGPRGRIYLIKNVLENNVASEKVQRHLDRCLTCGACETTCPSGVKYRRLLAIGREIVAQKIKRKTAEKIKQYLLHFLLHNKARFSFLLRVVQHFRPWLPKKLKNNIPKKQNITSPRSNNHQRQVILFRGCVHDAIAPDINASAIRVLDKLEISVIEVNELRCCGSLKHHSGDRKQTEKTIKKNIDALHARMNDKVEAIFMTASACSLMLKDYPALMASNKPYHKKALQLVNKFKDISEIICNEPFDKLTPLANKKTIAFHNPCSLQHGLKLTTDIENLLRSVGFTLVDVENSHLCCGSAGTYAILQPKISKQLLKNKVRSLTKNQPELIATANIGCLGYIQSACEIPVKHWITLFDI